MPLKSIILGDSKVTVVLGTLDQELRSVLVQEVRDSLGKQRVFCLQYTVWLILASNKKRTDFRVQLYSFLKMGFGKVERINFQMCTKLLALGSLVG